MGGSGSGSYWRWNSKQTVEDGLTLDLCKLIRQRLVIPGQHVSHTLIWSRVSDGEKVASIGYEANLIDPYTAWMRLHYKSNDKPMDFKVHLTTTRPNFGGLRWWFICPSNGSRVAKLHSPPGGDIFASRTAYNLAYQTQHESPVFRCLTRAQNLRQSLGGSTCISDSYPGKPKGMHWKTYWKRIDQIEKAEQTSLSATIQHFGLLDNLLPASLPER